MKRHNFIALAVALLLFGCAWLSVAEYDPALDQGASELQKKVETFLSVLRECTGTPEGEYARHTAFYAEARDDLAELRAVAETHAGNERTVRTLESIGENLDELEALHKSGMSSEEVALVAELLDTQFRMLAALEHAKKQKEQ